MPMTSQHTFHDRAPLWCLCLVFAAAALIAPPLHAQQATVAPDQLAARASSLASAGDFDDLVGTLREVPAEQLTDPHLAALRREVDRHQSLNAQRQAKTREAFDRRIAAMNEQLEKGDLVKAMARAVEAHDLAADPAAFLKRDDIVTMTRTAEQQAADFQARQQWLEALALYRRLQLLYDDQDRYRDHVESIARRMRMLRMYAPNMWFAESTRYATTHGDTPPKRWTGEDEVAWKKETDKVNSAMLRRALVLAARQHVESCTYEQLLGGGLDQLLTFLQTNGVEESFESVKNTQKVSAFVSELMAMKGRLDGRSVAMSYSDANAMIRDVLNANRKSVDLPEAVVVYEFGEGAISTLDQFSANIWPAQKARFERTTQGKFTGVGIKITLTDGELTVVSPLEDSPAHRAGMKAGDRIVTVDGKPTMGITLDQAVDQITGPEGTEVTLGIRSPGDDADRSITLTRATINITSTKGWKRLPGGQWDYYIDPTLRIGYVRITQFGPDTADALDGAVEKMTKAGGVNGLIIDLRFDPGGLLTAATAVCDRFFNDGVVVSGQVQAGAYAWQAKAYPHHTYKEFPVVVLINRGSASASEIVAGCLQDRKRAVIVGQRSYGKGSVQQVLWHSHDDGDEPQAALKLTTQYYVLPSGRVIHRRPGATDWGISPDIEVRMTDNEVEQLLKARMLLDVLRLEGEEVNADSLIGQGKIDDPDKMDDDQPFVPVTSASEILERGLDPQLETALIVLKAQLVADSPRS